jgi:hypothetical protein
MDKRQGWVNIVSIIGIIFFIGVVAVYYVIHKPFDAQILISIFQAFMDILLAFALIGLAGGIGRKILGEPHPNPLANRVLQAAFGLGLLVLAFLVVGFLGLFKTWFAWSLLLILILIFHRSIRDWLGCFADIRTSIYSLSNFSKILAVIALFIILLRLLEALAPPTHFDALVYHLWLPSRFLEAGKFLFTPENPYWGMPLSAELLYTWAMALGGPETAAVLGWLIGVITLAGVVGLGNRISPRAGWVAAAALLAGETLSSSLAWAYVDWGTALQGCALIIALDAWGLHKSRSTIIVAGLLAGFAFGFKLTAGLLIPASWAMIAIFGNRKEIRNAIIVFTLAAGSIDILWLGKNFLFTQSFLYPFWGDSDWIEGVRSQFFRGTVAPWPVLRILLIPLAATIEGVEGAPGFSANIGPLLIGLVVGIILLRNRTNQFIKGISAFVFVGWIVWIVATVYSTFLGQTRLYFSIFPAWALLAAAGYEGFACIRITQIRFEKLAGVFIVITLIFSGIRNFTDILQKEPMGVVLGLEEDGVYLTRCLGAYYPAMEAIRNLPPDSSVLNLWEPRGFYCMPICQADTWIDRWYVDRHEIGDEEEILESWREEGFTHILLHKAGMKFIQENDARYHDDDWEALENLLHQLSPVQSFGDGFELYRLAQ